jgi:hypothetical protein
MGDDPAAAVGRRRAEPIKINEDPRCPGVDIRKGPSLTNWDITHKDHGKFTYSRIPKADWNRIFGK